MVDAAIVVMAKTPVPGQVKTRLCPPLTHRQAAELYFSMLMDKLLQVSMCKKAQVLLALPEDTEQFGCKSLFHDFRLLSQRGETLGDRLAHCAEEAFSMGYRKVLLVDSDTPTLPDRLFSEALSALDIDQDGLVLGPNIDGGYYLIGFTALHKELFQDIPWSSNLVLEKTMQRSTDSGFSAVLLPEWHDIDTGADLLKLISELKCPLVQPSCPNVVSWLQEWLQSELHKQAHTQEQ